MPSTVIKSFYYDTDSRRLRVVFVTGIVYDYLEVPEEIYESMKNSDAKGIFLNREIKGHYEFEKIN